MTYPGGWNPNDTKSSSGKGDLNSSKNKQLESQLDEVMGIMKNNVNQMMERDCKLSELDQRAANLQDTAAHFQTTTKTLKRKFWWQNFKMLMILSIVIFLILLIIVVMVVGAPEDTIQIQIPEVDPQIEDHLTTTLRHD